MFVNIVIISVHWLLIELRYLLYILNTMATLSQNQTISTTRITVIDALRGFTLMGILITHMVEQYYAGQMPEKFAEQNSLLDTIVMALCFIVINGKFYAIFSFLFGLSFYIQFSKAKADLPFL